MYARCGVPEYLVLGLPEARLEVCRGPAGDGYYREVTSYGAGETVSPTARPEARIAVEDLLP